MRLIKFFLLLVIFNSCSSHKSVWTKGSLKTERYISIVWDGKLSLQLFQNDSRFEKKLFDDSELAKELFMKKLILNLSKRNINVNDSATDQLKVESMLLKEESEPTTILDLRDNSILADGALKYTFVLKSNSYLIINNKRHEINLKHQVVNEPRQSLLVGDYVNTPDNFKNSEKFINDFLNSFTYQIYNYLNEN